MSLRSPINFQMEKKIHVFTATKKSISFTRTALHVIFLNHNQPLFENENRMRTRIQLNSSKIPKKPKQMEINIIHVILRPKFSHNNRISCLRMQFPIILVRLFAFGVNEFSLLWCDHQPHINCRETEIISLFFLFFSLLFRAIEWVYSHVKCYLFTILDIQFYMFVRFAQHFLVVVDSFFTRKLVRL